MKFHHHVSGPLQSDVSFPSVGNHINGALFFCVTHARVFHHFFSKRTQDSCCCPFLVSSFPSFVFLLGEVKGFR